MSYKKFRWSKPTLKPNYILIPVNQVNFGQFNTMYHYCLKHGYNELKRTKSGGISLNQDFSFNYSVQSTTTGVELVIYNLSGWTRLQFRPVAGKDATNTLSGTKSFRRIIKEFEKDNIDITKYAIENGLEVKKTIEKPFIKLVCEGFKDKTYKNVHHLDINSSYPAGIANNYPELYNTINRIYLHRKEDKSLKLAMDSAIGYMQSKYCGYKYAQLSKSAITFNNEKIKAMLKYIVGHNCSPLLINTDGIWYKGDLLDINETHLGGWKTDHKNCTFRAKSNGAYEFIEDGKYQPVIRGRTRLDSIKSRSEWQWGDIYNISAGLYVKWVFKAGEGLIKLYIKE